MKESDFKLLIRPHARALRQLRLNLEYFVEDVGNILIYKISERVKSFESATQKARQRSLEIGEMDDLAGLRCVVGTNAEIEILARFVYRMGISKDLLVVKDNLISRENGYRARHIVVTVPGRYERSVFDGRVEVQLLTIFQHSFNWLSHAWVYKSTIKSNSDWNNRFQRLSRQLEQIENEVNGLHKELVDSSVCRNSNGVITPLSVKQVAKIHFDEYISIDDAVDVCRTLVDLGCDTIEKLWIFLERDDIAQFKEHISSQISSRNGQIFQTFLDMTKLHFWVFFGPRLQESYKLVRKLTE